MTARPGSPSRPHALIGLFVLVVCGLLVWGFLETYERVEVTDDVGYKGPALVNPFLALERLMDAEAVPTTTSLAGLPLPAEADGAAILLVSPRRSMSQQDTSRLLEWVGRGGRLIVTPADVGEGQSDPLLTHFGVRLKGVKKSGTELLCIAARKDLEPVEVLMESSPRFLDTRRTARHSGGSGPDGGAAILVFGHGEGEVTVLAEAGFLLNRHLGEQKHATFAHDLVDGDTLTQSLLIAFRDDVPPLIALIARHAPAALSSLVLLVLFWIWHAGARFGSIASDPVLHRRSLLEHLSASGEFLWRRGLSADLLDASRQALRTRLALRQPESAKLPPKDLVRKLASLAKLPLARVDRCLHGPPPRQPADFVETLRTLEAIRRSL